MGFVRYGAADFAELRDLHDVGTLERFLPDFARARGLLQFNQNHQYTVNEHCIRAVEFAENLLGNLDDHETLNRVLNS